LNKNSETVKIKLRDDIGSNMTANKVDSSSDYALYEMYKALQDAIYGVSDQQKTDANTTVALGQFEMKLNNYWYGPANGNENAPNSPLQNYVDLINNLVGSWNNVNNSEQDVNDMMTKYNSEYRIASANASNATGYVDAKVQQSNSQVKTDSDNIKSLCSLAQTLNVMSFVLQLSSSS
jgi:hypothetical protein